jgi:hypothetical protein
MGHTVQAFIAKDNILWDAARATDAASLIPIEQGLASG